MKILSACRCSIKIATLLVAFMFVAAGCATTDKIITDQSVKRSPTSKVEVYKGQLPPKPYKEFARFSYLGPAEDEIKATKFFASEAKKIGADAIIIEWPPHGDVKSLGLLGPNGGGFGSSVAYVFKATAVIWEEESDADIKSGAELIGHWESVSFKVKNAEPGIEKFEFDFMPGNRFVATTFKKDKGYPMKGRYYVKGDKLVIWTDGDPKPDSSASFSLIDNQLAISSSELQITYQKSSTIP